jgi:hypothetical protein
MEAALVSLGEREDGDDVGAGAIDLRGVGPAKRDVLARRQPGLEEDLGPLGLCDDLPVDPDRDAPGARGGGRRPLRPPRTTRPSCSLSTNHPQLRFRALLNEGSTSKVELLRA